MSEGFFAPSALKGQAVLPRLPACGKCGLWKGCKLPKMKVYGQGKKKIMIVAEAPGADEDSQGTPFVGKTGQHLQDVLRKVGINMFDDCWCANAAACRPPDNDLPPAAIEHCRPKIIREIEEYKPEVLILIGGVPVKSIIGHLWKEDTKGITRWAGFQIPCQRWNCWICPTYHPSYVLRERDNNNPVPGILFERHLKAAAYTAGGPVVDKFGSRPWRKVPDYSKQVQVFMDPYEAAKEIWSLIDQAPFAFDFETTTLKPDGPHAEIVCCSVANHNGAIAFPWKGAVVPLMEELLADPDFKKIGWNAKFEHRWMLAKQDTPVRGWVWDGMLAAHAIDSRAGITGLKFQSFIRLGQEDYDSEIKPYLKAVPEGGNNPNRIREVPMSDLLTYCGMDSLLEYKVAIEQSQELEIEL